MRRRLRRQSNRSRLREQARTVEGATNWGKQWTGPELEIVSRPDMSARRAALMLGRTLYAVKHIRRKLEIDPRKINVAGLARRRSGRDG